MKNFLRNSLNTAYVVPACMWEKRMPAADPGVVNFLQHLRFRSMISHAWRHVPFYRNAMEERGLGPSDFRTVEDLSLLPLVSNEEFRSNPSIFNSEKMSIEKDVLMSAGHYKRIFWSRKAALQWFARLTRTRVVLNRLLGQGSGYIAAYISPKEDSNHYMNRFWGESILLKARAEQRFWLDANESYQDTLGRLNEIGPDIVYCYGSHTERFFRHISKYKLEFRAPRIWVYGSDMMSPGMREFIEEQYGCLVYSAYSMNEMGAFSFECERRRGFHLNIDACHTRIVDDNGGTLPDGIAGEVIISNLVNKATVILNYRTGDRARMSLEPCPCGRTLPLLQELEGRVCDSVYCENGNSISHALLAVPAGELLRRVSNFQIVQERRGHVCWNLVPFPDTSRDDTAVGLAAISRSIMPPPNTIEVKWVEQIEETPRQKRRFVIHRFNE